MHLPCQCQGDQPKGWHALQCVPPESSSASPQQPVEGGGRAAFHAENATVACRFEPCHAPDEHPSAPPCPVKCSLAPDCRQVPAHGCENVHLSQEAAISVPNLLTGIGNGQGLTNALHSGQVLHLLHSHLATGCSLHGVGKCWCSVLSGYLRGTTTCGPIHAPFSTLGRGTMKRWRETAGFRHRHC